MKIVKAECADGGIGVQASTIKDALPPPERLCHDNIIDETGLSNNDFTISDDIGESVPTAAVRERPVTASLD